MTYKLLTWCWTCKAWHVMKRHTHSPNTFHVHGTCTAITVLVVRASSDTPSISLGEWLLRAIEQTEKLGLLET
jgi:hypothetical protein